MDTNNGHAPDTLITVKDVCARLAISRATLYNRLKGDPTFPQPLRFIGRCVRFRESDIAAFVARAS